MKKHISVIFITIVLLYVCLPLNLLAQTESPLTISEVMFYPEEKNGEFVEIFNTSATQTIDITGYKINYNNVSSNDNIVAVSGGLSLAPGQFAIILEGDYDFDAGIYMSMIPGDALLLKIGDNSFGTSSSGMAGTSDRVINLKDAAGNVVDSYTYSAGNSSGYSDEKIQMTKDNLPENWANSNSMNGTPGSKNSVTPLLDDLVIDNFSFDSKYGIDNAPVLGILQIKNGGMNSAEEYSIKIYKDLNSDSVAQAEEILTDLISEPIEPGETKRFEFIVNDYSLGDNSFIVVLNFDADGGFAGIITNEKRGDIVINEIMYTPESPEPEWIELFNNSQKTIDLFQYKAADANDTLTVVTDSIFLYPEEFIVIAKDSSILDIYNIPSKIVFQYFPSLNNTGDRLMILDSLGRVIDSLTYDYSWGGNNGKSLERILYDDSSTAKTNWGTSANLLGSTPGLKNSVLPKKYDLVLSGFSFDSDFVIDDENANAKVIVKNEGMLKADSYLINIYKDSNGDKIPQPQEYIFQLNSIPIAAKDSIIYDIALEHDKLNPGENNFIGSIAYSLDEDTTNNSKSALIKQIITNEQRGDIVINEIMYAPNSPEPEWIEVYNKSDKTIDLNGYQIADNSTKKNVIHLTRIVNPGEYLVIASDSSFYEIYTDIKNVVVSSFPSLNNSSDRIVLMDSLDRAIDSLEYKSSWGGSSGCSLERYKFDRSSTDSTNWGSSLFKLGGTPGKINSVSKKNYDAGITGLFFSPFHPLSGNDVKLKTVVKSFGRNEFSTSITLSEMIGDSLENKIEESSFVTINTDDSIEYNFIFTIKSLSSKRTFKVLLNSSVDENPLNDTIKTSVIPGFSENDVRINEIMFAPLNGEPEWI